MYITSKYKKHQIARARYEMKRRAEIWIVKKEHRKEIRRNEVRKQTFIRKHSFNHIAPKNFNFIDNTNDVLEYYTDAKTLSRKYDFIRFDISKIETLTPDAIALHLASLHDKRLNDKKVFSGNAPQKPQLKKLFTQSGFYNFVKSKGIKGIGEGNIFHKETHFKVKPVIARDAAMAGIMHTFESSRPYEPLYNILIECMSNTNNHASLDSDQKCYWWLYVYCDPVTRNTIYSFLDLGVGIFESIVVQNYVKQFFKGSFIYPHINLVDDLLAGKIQSRLDEDQEIRGKGIPQIVGYSKLPEFKKFYLISNDVKIDLKTGRKFQLSNSFIGTFFYWEIQKLVE